MFATILPKLTPEKSWFISKLPDIYLTHLSTGVKGTMINYVNSFVGRYSGRGLPHRLIPNEWTFPLSAQTHTSSFFMGVSLMLKMLDLLRYFAV